MKSYTGLYLFTFKEPARRELHIISFSESHR